MHNTYVIAADFSTKNNLSNKSDLELSLNKINFSNYIIFNHKKVSTGMSKISNPKLSILNPMGKFPKAIRFAMRSQNNKIINNLLSLIFKNNLFFMVPHNIRFFYYKGFLDQLNPDDFVFLVDSRDLIFQISPNKLSDTLYSSNGINFFDERLFQFRDNSIQIIGNSEGNQKWLKYLIGNSHNKLDNLTKEFIINTGCIAGSVKSLNFYLDYFCSKIRYNANRFRMLDQAAANLFAYSGELSPLDIMIHQNGEIVLNMCGVIEKNVELINGSLLIDNQKVPIVHQYDRFAIYSPELGLKFSHGKAKYQNL